MAANLRGEPSPSRPDRGVTMVDAGPAALSKLAYADLAAKS